MILYFIVISSSDISWTVLRTMSTSITMMCVLMLLVVSVSFKKYIVETEDELDLSTEDDERKSKGENSDNFEEKTLKDGISSDWIRSRNTFREKCVRSKKDQFPIYCRNMMTKHW